MSEDRKRSAADGWPTAWMEVPEAMKVQMDAWVREQAELLESTQESLTRWMTRRQEAIEAVVQMTQKIGTAKEFGTVAAAYADWLKGSMERLRSDLNDARDEALRFAEIGRRSFAAAPERPATETDQRPVKPGPTKSAAE